jgi:hypothetical protein
MGWFWKDVIIEPHWYDQPGFSFFGFNDKPEVKKKGL